MDWRGVHRMERFLHGGSIHLGVVNGSLLLSFINCFAWMLSEDETECA